MPFVELYAPSGALNTERGHRAKRELVAEVMRAEGAPDTEAARSISWLTVIEPKEWYVGDAELDSGQPPRYVVRVSVPAGSLTDAKRADLVRRVTKVLADAEEDEGDGQRLYREPVAWVHINEVPEGNWGALGRPIGLADIIGFVNAPVPTG